MWEAGWLGFREHPALGIGLGNDRRDYEQYRRLVAERHGGHRYLNPPDVGVHNLYLQIAYELGLVGLAAYLGLVGSLFAWCAAGLRRAGPAHDLESGILWGTAAALAGSMAAGLFENNFFDSEVQNLLVILFGLVLHAGVAVGLGSARAAAPGGKR
jgi:O-antigen ligase